MASSRVSQRYAKSLIDLAFDQGTLDEVFEDVKTFLGVAGHRDFKLLLKSPVINQDKKLSVFKDLFEGKVSGLSFSFLDIILRKKREALLPSIMEAFVEQYNELRKRSKITITSASAMSKAELEDLKVRIISSKVTHPDLEVNCVIDKDIIGGFSLDIGGTKYDASVRSKLESLRKEFLN